MGKDPKHNRVMQNWAEKRSIAGVIDVNGITIQEDFS